MLPMITLTVDEVVAMGQHVRDAIRRGDRDGSAWKVFWLGGQAGDSTADDRTPAIAEAHDNLGRVLRASLWGASVPWNLALVAVLGACLLLAPSMFFVDIRSGAADVAHIGGAFVIVAAVISWDEPVRALRLLNVPAGLAISGLVFLTDPKLDYAAAMVTTGLVIAALSLRRGDIRDAYGSWRLLTR